MTLEQEKADPTVQKKMIVTATTQDDLTLIVSALSAYQHNTRYRALYERLVAQLKKCGGDVTQPLLLSS